MKPSLVEEEDDDMPDSSSMKSISQTYSSHSRLRSRTQQSQPSDGAGSRAACDAIQGVAPATTEREVEVQVEDSSDMDDEVLKEKSMHLPMRCNYWEATDRLPTLAPKKTQATQSSWGSEDVGEEKRVVTFADVGAPQAKKAATAAVNATNLPTQKNHTHSSYASLPQAQSVGLSAEGNEFEIWDETWGVAGAASRSEGKHPTQSEHCNLELKSEKAKGTCGRITSLCARHRRKFCCCGVSLGLLLVATATCLGLFWPRDPTWKVTKLQVNAGELSKLVTAVSGSDSLNLAPQSLLFVAEVEVFNPNLLGGDSDEGQLHLTYQGHRMGTGKMEPSSVPAQSAVKLQATMNLDLPLDFVQSIQSELEADRAALVFKAFAETKVGSSLGMQVNFKVDCDIDVSLSFLMMKETQDRAVTGRNCRYTFF